MFEKEKSYLSQYLAWYHPTTS